MNRETCSECGQLNPHLAYGQSNPRSAHGPRALIYEGFSPKGKVFTYERDGRCMACRHGTGSRLQKQPAGKALTAWLVKENARKGV